MSSSSSKPTKNSSTTNLADADVGGPPKGVPHQQTHILKTAADLRKEYEPVRWTVEGLVPEGGVVIDAGAPAIGKTWMNLDLAIHVARGIPWLGRFSTRPGRVLLVLEEEDPNAVVERLDMLYAASGLSIEQGDGLNCAYIIDGGVRIVRSDVLDTKLKGTVLEYQPSLIIIDPFRRVHDLDENDSGEMSMLFKRLRELTRLNDTPASVLMSHHVRKAGGFGGPQDRVRGSTDIAGSLDGMLVVDGKFPDIKIEHAKSKRGPTLPDFRVHFEVGHDTMLLEYRDDAIDAEDQRERGYEAIREVLRNGPMNQSQFWNGCRERGFGRDRIGTLFTELAVSGEVEMYDGDRSAKMYRLVVAGNGPTTTDSKEGC
jgi:hypothetical protein